MFRFFQVKSTKTLFSWIFLLSVFSSCAQSDVVEDGNSLLWKIEGKDCHTSYLFGTMHMIEEQYFSMSESLIEKITSSDEVIMEVGGMPDPFETLQLMSLDSGKVHDFFTQEQLPVLLEFFDKKLGTDPETFRQVYGNMKPFFILQAISQSYFSENSVSYDLNIMALSKEHDIPLYGLETIEEQLGFFSSIPPDEMANLIIESIENYEKEKKNTNKLMKIYAEEDVEKLIPLMNRQSPEFMAYSDVFLYNRNKAWVPKIETEISTKKCFIAVGAAHLFGEGGLIDLLKKAGYTVTAVSTK